MAGEEIQPRAISSTEPPHQIHESRKSPGLESLLTTKFLSEIPSSQASTVIRAGRARCVEALPFGIWPDVGRNRETSLVGEESAKRKECEIMCMTGEIHVLRRRRGKQWPISIAWWITGETIELGR